MKNLRITEEEVRNILSMHRVLMNEQLSKTVDVNSTDYKGLSDAKSKGCLSGGEIFKDDSGKHYYRKPSVKSPGKEVDFFADMTYKFVDNSASGKWKCDDIIKLDVNKSENSITEQETSKTLDDNQTQILGWLKEKGWSPTPVPTGVELSKGRFVKLDLSKQYKDGDKLEGGEGNEQLVKEGIGLANLYNKWFKDDYPEFFVYKRSAGKTQTPTGVGGGSRVEVTIESCRTAIESLYNNMISPRSYPLLPEDISNHVNMVRTCIEPANKGKFFAKFGLRSKVKELRQRRRI